MLLEASTPQSLPVMNCTYMLTVSPSLHLSSLRRIKIKSTSYRPIVTLAVMSCDRDQIIYF